MRSVSDTLFQEIIMRFPTLFACAAALLDGRTYVIPRDVTEMYEAIGGSRHYGRDAEKI